MPATFFPLTYEDYLQRKALIMVELKSCPPQDMPLREFFWLSSEAARRRAARRKAASENKFVED